MLRDNVSTVASTKKGNIAFNDATSAGIMLATCPTAWWNQYKMSHRTDPEFPGAMLQDLENIEKDFVEQYNKKARVNKAKVGSAGTAPHMPRKFGNGGSSKGLALKKGCTTKYCKWCKANGGPFTMHDTVKCRRFDKDGKQKYKPDKPFDSAKKPWKRGGGDSGYMAYLTEKVEKLEKKHQKTKKRVHDLSDSDSASD